ncbi:MAG: lipoate--protein ligase family protein [Actinobacteria bacterium]|nr:lipoate--protein ligase family protein [Actinomycetota bacterium]
MLVPCDFHDDLDTPLDASDQMGADLALLDAVEGGGPMQLRLYRWQRPALSLGRFQPEDQVDLDACRTLDVDVVRRPTGGQALLHGSDLTYAIALARPGGREGSVDAVYGSIARGLIAGLARVGVSAEVARHRGPAGPACFSSERGSDLRARGRKLVGSAQVRRGGAVLQHGSVLLDRLAFDESDLLVFETREARTHAHRRLRGATITLAELGSETRPEALGDALAAGFAEALDLDLDFRSRSFVAGAQGRQ